MRIKRQLLGSFIGGEKIEAETNLRVCKLEAVRI